MIGHLQVGIQRQRNYVFIISIGMGGRDLVYKYRLVAELVLEQAWTEGHQQFTIHI